MYRWDLVAAAGRCPMELKLLGVLYDHHYRTHHALLLLRVSRPSWRIFALKVFFVIFVFLSPSTRANNSVSDNT